MYSLGRLQHNACEDENGACVHIVDYDIGGSDSSWQ